MKKILKRDYYTIPSENLEKGKTYTLEAVKTRNRVTVKISEGSNVIENIAVILGDEDKRRLEFLPVTFTYSPGIKLKLERMRFGHRIISKRLIIL